MIEEVKILRLLKKLLKSRKLNKSQINSLLMNKNSQIFTKFNCTKN